MNFDWKIKTKRKPAKKEILKPAWKKIYTPIWVPTERAVVKEIDVPAWKQVRRLTKIAYEMNKNSCVWVTMLK